MKVHKEFTIAWIILFFLILTGAVVVYVYYFGSNAGTEDMTGLVIFEVITAVVLLNFYGLKVQVGDKLTASFGIGLIRKRIQFADIQSVKSVTNPWYYGWGVRIIPNGLMFNVTGSKAVEISFNNTNRVFRIGTKNPEVLIKEIEQRLN